MDLARIDLNLLVSLDVLLEERNVTRAATRLHVSQPAMSAQLARLRQLFGDPLLVPLQKGRGMTPTARALSLQGPLRMTLRSLGAVIHGGMQFDPLADERTFHIAIGDAAASIVALPLVARLASRTGAGIRLTFSTPDPRRIAAQMDEGVFDLLIDAARVIPPGLVSAPLLTSPFAMGQRKGHPRGRRPLDLDAYCALHHVVVTPEPGSLRGHTDDALDGLGRKRHATLAVSQTMMVRDILLSSDQVCTLPRLLFAPWKDVVDLFPLPFPTHDYQLVLAWHARDDADPAIGWLRGQIGGAMRRRR